MPNPDPALLHNAPTPKPREPRPTELLWTLRKGDKRVEGRLLDHGQYGVELQLYLESRFYGGRRFNMREAAIEYGEALRADLERTGWSRTD